MIPLFASVYIRKKRKPKGFRIWIPLFLFWLLLLPILAILFPFFMIACLFTHLDPLHVIAVFWGILSGLKGTHIEVEEEKHHFLIQVR